MAKMYHGKDSSPDAKRVLHDFSKVNGRNVITPLSQCHYMETARVVNVGRRQRLGEVMWKFSFGITMANHRAVVRHELSTAVAKNIPGVQVVPLKLLGYGVGHVFDLPPWSPAVAAFQHEIEPTFFTGSAALGIDPPMFPQTPGREAFRKFLADLAVRKKDLPKHQWDDWLHAIVLMDIIDPITKLFSENKLPADTLSRIGKDGLSAIVEDMPSRRLDLHLLREVLRNESYKPKETDLEDWVGVGTASCYCDVVVCEKHMADMLRRNHFLSRSRVVTHLRDVF
ncbi:MAG: hypothetical protein NT171_16695 [Planctomycetota bacterium]|nr:hypothetical protein [Planctomycetota bacterium]